MRVESGGRVQVRVHKCVSEGGGGDVEDRIKSLSVFKLLAIKRYRKPDSLLIRIYSWIGYPSL